MVVFLAVSDPGAGDFLINDVKGDALSLLRGAGNDWLAPAPGVGGPLAAVATSKL